MAAAHEPSGLIGIGYEGKDLQGFVDELRAASVSLVVDVRLNAVSRKPGFSKEALAAALRDAGIGYEHAPELGNPKPNRAGFAGSPAELQAARSRFSQILAGRAAADRMARIAEAAATRVVAVLCFEADDRRCHRSVILDAGLAGQAAVVRAGPQSPVLSHASDSVLDGVPLEPVHGRLGGIED
jgi:uncharacterized protein (DUF488 family)